MPDTPSSDVLERLRSKADDLDAGVEFYADEVSSEFILAAIVIEERDATIERLSAELERAEARIARTMAVIENGYGVNKYDKCPHDRYGYEDCIACYDGALTEALTHAPRQDGEDNGNGTAI